MQRRKFVLATLAFYPLTLLAKMKPAFLIEIGKGFKVKSGETRFGEHYKMRGVTLNTLDVKISSKDTDGALAMFEQIGQTPLGGPPLHIHLYQDEFFYVVEGDYRFRVGDEFYSLSAGDTIYLPRNVPHAFIQLTEKAKMIVSYFPAGKMENFFKLTSTWTSPPSKEVIDQAFLDNDMKVVGAPLTVE